MDNKHSLERHLVESLYYSMQKIRMVEERIALEYPNQEIRCPTHLSIGQEGVPGALSTLLDNEDLAVSTHRGHAHYLAKGGNLNKMIAEIFGKETGCSGGKGGSMHLIDKSVGFMGTSAIVGNSIPLGVGLGFSIRLKNKPNLACIFIGDGAIEEGVFYESLNFAVLKELPILFICENNLYSVYSPLSVRQPKGRSINKLASAIGAKTAHCDGNNVLETRSVLNEIISDIKYKNPFPWFVEFDTYRWREHCGYQFDNDIGYRTQEEFEKWKLRDPIKLFLENFGDIDFTKINENLANEVNEAFQKAKTDPFPQKEEAYKSLYKL